MYEGGARQFREAADTEELHPSTRFWSIHVVGCSASNEGYDFLDGLVLNPRREKREQKRGSILFPKLRDRQDQSDHPRQASCISCSCLRPMPVRGSGNQGAVEYFSSGPQSDINAPTAYDGRLCHKNVEFCLVSICVVGFPSYQCWLSPTPRRDPSIFPSN
jgi:hypothetical protein